MCVQLQQIRLHSILLCWQFKVESHCAVNVMSHNEALLWEEFTF